MTKFTTSWRNRNNSSSVAKIHCCKFLNSGCINTDQAISTEFCSAKLRFLYFCAISGCSFPSWKLETPWWSTSIQRMEEIRHWVARFKFTKKGMSYHVLTMNQRAENGGKLRQGIWRLHGQRRKSKKSWEQTNWSTVSQTIERRTHNTIGIIMDFCGKVFPGAWLIIDIFWNDDPT